MPNLPDGLMHFPQFFDPPAQEALLKQVRSRVSQAPLFIPRMPSSGKPMRVKITNFGPLGWMSDQQGGYRYQSTHPITGNAWPDIPDMLMQLWEDRADWPVGPQACLVNYYAPDAKMGLHQDRDEQVLEAPVVSVSLGDTCLFRFGGQNRNDPTRSIRLSSGDVLILSGPARMLFHGVDRIYPETSSLLRQPGRINLTLRRVTP